MPVSVHCALAVPRSNVEPGASCSFEVGFATSRPAFEVAASFTLNAENTTFEPDGFLS
jgi:hypothetical protein